jgi:hypothetical protein
MRLHRYNLATQQDIIIASGIGRSLHKIPTSSTMSFVHKISDQEWLIKKLKEDGSIETITATLPGREDLTWTPDGRIIIMSDGKKLFHFVLGKSSSWEVIEIPANMPGGTITRLAVSPRGDKLSFVVSE